MMSQINTRARELHAPTEAEAALLRKLLSVDFPGRDALAAQVESARVSWIEAKGVPAMLFFIDPTVGTASVEARVAVEAVAEDADGVVIHLLLHVVDGYIDILEPYREDGEPLQTFPSPESLQLVFSY